MRVRLAFPMLEDPVRAVRMETARLLAGIPIGDLPAEQRVLLDKALEEFIVAQQANAERPESQANLGNLYAAQGKTAEAIAAYNAAIELDVVFVPAYVNLADFYRVQGDEAEAEKVLRRAIVSPLKMPLFIMRWGCLWYVRSVLMRRCNNCEKHQDWILTVRIIFIFTRSGCIHQASLKKPSCCYRVHITGIRKTVTFLMPW